MSFPTASLAPLRWGIVSTGHIAGVFARGLVLAHDGKLIAVGSRNADSSHRFAAEHGIAAAHAHASYEALFADSDVEAVYVATPHPWHADVVVQALAAGKHVLCEKPMGMDLAEIERMQAAALEHGRTLMEAWMYRCHPQTIKLLELVRDGAIGTVRHLQGAFSYNTAFVADGRHWNKAMGGGGILDVGGYPLSYARLLAGVESGQPFLEPEILKAVGWLHPVSGVDDHTTAILRFAGGMTAEVSCGVGVNQENVVRIYGTTGWIEVPSPYVVAREPEPTTLIWHRDGMPRETVTIVPDRGLYGYEADAFAAAVRAGSLEVPACSWADTRGNMAALMAWCGEIGLSYT